MSKKKPPADRADPLDEKMKPWADRRQIGGSKNGYLNCMAANQVLGTLWRGRNEDPESKEIRDTAALARVAGIGPRDVLEGMLAAQLVATHEAAMECFRRAHLLEQTLAGRELALKYADKLTRSFAGLVETLDRHRSKGQPQVVRVERVTVEAGGQAIVGAVTQGGGGRAEQEDRAHARAITHAPEPEMRCADPSRDAVPLAGGKR